LNTLLSLEVAPEEIHMEVVGAQEVLEPHLDSPLLLD
jgi:hypothetical protein